MGSKEGKKDKYFWQEEGEKIFLYILLTVLILAGLMFWLSQNAQARQLGENVLNTTKETVLNTYKVLKENSNDFKDQIANFSYFNYSVEADERKESEKNRTEAEKSSEKEQEKDDNKASAFVSLALIFEKESKKKVKENKEIGKETKSSIYYHLKKIKEKQAAQAASSGSPVIKDGRYIDIDVSSQTLTLFKNGNKVAAYPISSGSPSHPTPYGRYSVNNKSLNAYAAKYDLYMPFWMAFIGSSYGIHELPEYANGYKEGAEYLGRAVSHGCVRLGVGAAQRVYSWTPVGTRVIVHQ